MNKKKLVHDINKNFFAIKSLLKQEDKINNCIGLIYKKIINGGKILLCGNGGSAADAQHLAAEFLIRLRPNKKRNPIPAMSLATDISTITACGNDFHFSDIFKRSFEALSKPEDILIVISTSGNSKNILKVLLAAKKRNIISIAFLGGNGGKAKNLCSIPLIVKSNVTARIQESHIFLGHYIFEGVEDLILNK